MRPRIPIRLAFIILMAWATALVADTVASRSAELRLEEDHYVLDADFDLNLNLTLEEAIVRGVPLYFVVEFDLRYEAAVRLRLDTTQLPKPFQITALTSRDWNLQSEWVRWSFTP
jgi:uncharacterized protein DUF4390